MPRGPNGEKRPADVNICAVTVAKIATGELYGIEGGWIKGTEYQVQTRIEGAPRRVSKPELIEPS